MFVGREGEDLAHALATLTVYKERVFERLSFMNANARFDCVAVEGFD